MARSVNPRALPAAGRAPSQMARRCQLPRQLSETGFIGPIGDDLPSLIPLIFGLIIFFSTFTLTLANFDDRNKAIDAKLEVLQIARILRSDGFIDGMHDFQSLCALIPQVKTKYLAGLIDLSRVQQPSVFASELDFISSRESNNFFSCQADAVTEGELETLEHSKTIALIYPIALQENNVVAPVHLVVVAWS